MNSTFERPVIFINSGAYVDQELAAEFGALPPAFLPVGVDRLYELQARMLAPLDGDLYLTLPDSFELPDWDAARLDSLNIKVVRTADGLSLGAALMFALGVIGFRERQLRILHGDTLVDGIDLDSDDAVAVAAGRDSYRWGQVTIDEQGFVRYVAEPGRKGSGVGDWEPRLCGYFAFASATRFAEKLAMARGDFFEALAEQAISGGFRALKPKRWLDFGHVQTFFQSRRIVTTARAFNSLQVSETHVRKRSSNELKIRAEARWLREAPSALAPFCARILDEGEDKNGYFYDTEYEYMPTLAELHVFGRLGPGAWSRIFQSCADFIATSVALGTEAPTGNLLGDLVIDKTFSRLEAYSRAAELDLDVPNKLNGRLAPSLRQCAEDMATRLEGCGRFPSLMHGDFCFSNIMFSFRTGRIRVIDPRGLGGDGQFNLYGDVRYDLAKLMHSIWGCYDLIIAGQFTGGRTGANAFELNFAKDPNRLQIETMAKGLTMSGVNLGSEVVLASTISLFLSMAPLHADRPDRQVAFIANALRLHLAIEGSAP